jgi:hypothetical protein
VQVSVARTRVKVDLFPQLEATEPNHAWSSYPDV